MDIFEARLAVHVQTLNEKCHAKHLIKREIYDEVILVLPNSRGDLQSKY